MKYKELLNEMCYDCKFYPCQTLKNGDHCCTYNELAEALKKQIPKKPIKLTCPTCGFDRIDNSWWVFTCCPQCGQRIDWTPLE